jgi:hypothetical protein
MEVRVQMRIPAKMLAIAPIVTFTAAANGQTPPAESAVPPPAAVAPLPAAASPAPVEPALAKPPAPPPPVRPTIDLRPPAPPPEPCAPKDEPSEGAGAFFLGVGLFDFSALNHRLRENGYERIAPATTLLGGEGHAVFPSGFVAGAHGGALLTPDGDGPSGLQRTFGGGFGMIDLGLALVQRPAFLLTLTSGIGGYGMSLGISDGQSARFDDVLKNPGRSSSISRGGLLVGLAVGVDGRVPVGKVERGRRGFFTLGARLGALYGPPLGSWSLAEGGNATRGPGSGLAGIYGAAVLGFGGGPQPERPGS